jgi:hypothetical protein
MQILTFGEIMDLGNSVFTAITQLDNEDLIVKFKGVVRSSDPYKDLRPYLNDMELKLKDIKINQVQIDFTELKYCNSTGFYVLMDIIEIIYNNTHAAITIKRLKNDDWQQETLPILINIEDKERSSITKFKDEEEMSFC